jgi:hypothetical protein
MRTALIALTTLALAVGLLYFPVRFALTFELFGYAVVSPSAGWLGPTPRDAGKCVVDAGKVNVWQCQDTSVFAKHRVGCKLWLDFFGYSGA